MPTDTVNPVQATADQIGVTLMKALFEEITALRMPWAITPQQMQQEVLDRLRARVDTAVRAAVSGIVSSGFNCATVALESLTIKDGAKATLILSRGTEAMHTFADHIGSAAIVVFADPKDYLAQMESIRAQADQPSLPLE